jgi:hypothetical protein
MPTMSASGASMNKLGSCIVCQISSNVLKMRAAQADRDVGLDH